MISKGHKKHSDIAKPSCGSFGRNEWAILGAKCETIKELAHRLIEALSPQYICANIDSDHKNADAPGQLPGQLSAGAVTEYTNEINHHQFLFNKSFTPYQYRQLFSDADLVLVNGNHHEAQAQVLIIDESKKASVQKRLSQLSNVQLILFGEGQDEPFDFMKEALPSWREIPQYNISDTNNIVAFLKKQMLKTRPVLNGLVLAGGKSERLGQDKGKIEWHGKEQRYHVADMLRHLCNEVYISCRAEQQHEINSSYKTLPDTFTGLGPYGAILSAFRSNPDAAWFVIACDLPLLDTTSLQFLVQHRDISRIATTFESPHDGLPEPLITIWEPKSYPVLLSFLSQGNSCPRKALRNNEVKIIKASQPEQLLNVNTPEDSEKAGNIIHGKSSSL